MCGGGYSFSMWQMWQMWQTLSKCILLDFPTKIVGFSNSLFRAKAVPLHRVSKRAETTKTTKTTKNYARNYESPYLPAAQPKHKGRVQPPTALPNAYHAYLRQDCRRTRHLRRPR